MIPGRYKSISASLLLARGSVTHKPTAHGSYRYAPFLFVQTSILCQRLPGLTGLCEGVEAMADVPTTMTFAGGAVLQADGSIPPAVDAHLPRFAIGQTPPPQPPAEPAEGDEDIPVPAEPAEPGEPQEPPVEPTEPAPAEDYGQRPGESNRKFRARLWSENQNYQARHAELLQQQQEQQARIAYLEGHLTALQRPPVEPQGEPPSAQLQTLPGLRPRPQPHQYPDYQVYEDDLLNWRDEARAAEAAVRQRADADRQVQTQWAQRTEDGR